MSSVITITSKAFDDASAVFNPEVGSPLHAKIVHGDFTGRGLAYTLNGHQHYVSSDEVDAIERSGRSEWRNYAVNATVYPDPIHGAWKHLNDRPGATMPIKGLEELDKGFSHWSAAEDKRLVDMLMAGVGVALISPELRRSIQSVEMRIKRRGLREIVAQRREQAVMNLYGTTRAWSKYEDLELMALKERGVPFQKIAVMFGRTVEQVRNRWHRYVKTQAA